jgi:glycosyltransferase involved in cell wall biosynthesis
MKSVLYIIPYTQLYPPCNGGMLRNYFLCHELSKYCDVTLLTLQSASAFKDGINDYRWNTSVKLITPDDTAPSGGIFQKVMNAIKGRIYQRSFFSSASGLMLFAYPRLKTLSQRESFDVVIFAHLGSLILVPRIRKLFPRAFRILDAHNVDHLLYKQGNDLDIPAHRKEYEQLKAKETTLNELVHAFTVCSEKDKNILEKLNKHKIKGYVVPNGANTYLYELDKEKNFTLHRLIFCGSLDYQPNKDGLLWFYTDVWPLVRRAFPDAILTIVGRNGSCREYDQLKQDQSIEFVGQVASVIHYYNKSSIAIVPLRMGSGTRLKILEAMSLGTPVISTSIGAEGIEYADFENIVIADSTAAMADAIIHLFTNPELSKQLSVHGRALINQNYSWKMAGREMASVISNQKLNEK